MNKFALIIATKDRPAQLQRLLNNIAEQSLQPDQIVVVDGSDNPNEDISAYLETTDIEYIRIHPPALTKQKNAGVNMVKGDIDLVGFVDDDVIFEKNSLAEMISFWQYVPENQGGAGFNLCGYKYSDSWLRSFFQRIFFIDDSEFGRVLRSGFNTRIWDTEYNQSSDWLGGGYTVWRKKIFETFSFNEWFVGSGLWEDVFFSHSVRRKYCFTIVAKAKAYHLEGPVPNSQQIRIGKTQILNWVYFVRHNSDLSLIMCLWACSGRTSWNLTKSLLTLNVGLGLRSIGNTIGLAYSVIKLITPMIGRPSN